jgi:predicted dehydrogenase
VTGPLGIGLVGAGGFGAFCVGAFEELTDARVVAVMDTDLARAETIAPQGAAPYDDLETLLSDRAVDIVHIATPPHLHGAFARRTAERGKHVLVEKPLATTDDEARAAVEAAQSAGVLLSINFVLRHHPIHRLALELTRTGALGRLQHFALENFASSQHLPPDHWFWDLQLSGGIHVEHGIHFIDLLLAHAGQQPDAVAGTAQVRADGRVDRVDALLCFGDTLVASMYHSFNRDDASERTSLRLAFEHGHATIEGWIPTRLDVEGSIAQAAEPTMRTLLGDSLRTVEAQQADRAARMSITATIEYPEREHQYRLAVRAGMNDLVAAIRRGQDLTVTPQDGLRSLVVALQASNTI